jgi:hypothetical protein
MSVSSHQASKKPLLSDTQYNVLKHAAQVGLPALSALYIGLSQVWHLPDTEQVVATIAVVNTALGGLLHYSTVSYNASDAKYAGIIQVVEDDLKKTFSLNLNHAPEALEKMATATFKVESTPAAPVEQAPSGFAEPQNPPTFSN